MFSKEHVHKHFSPQRKKQSHFDINFTKVIHNWSLMITFRRSISNQLLFGSNPNNTIYNCKQHNQSRCHYQLIQVFSEASDAFFCLFVSCLFAQHHFSSVPVQTCLVLNPLYTQHLSEIDRVPFYPLRWGWMPLPEAWHTPPLEFRGHNVGKGLIL